MNFRLVFKVAGKTLMVEAITMLLPLLVCLIYQEDPTPFLFTIPLVMVIGFALSLLPSDDHFFTREGFFAVALIWLLVGAFGALPFYFSGYFSSYIDCFFEAVSGFATVGVSSGVTAVSTPISKIALILSMFIGRVGPVSFGLSLAGKSTSRKVILPEGKIIVG